MSLSISACFFFTTAQPVFAKTSAKPPRSQEETEQLIAEFVQEVVSKTYYKIVGETVQRIIRINNIQIFPQIAMEAIQQATIQSFKQEDLKTELKDIYDENFEEAKTSYNEGVAAGDIQQNIQNNVEEAVQPMTEDPLFRFIIEQVLEMAILKHRRIVMMTVAQRQAQLAAIRMQELEMQRAIQREYVKQVLEAVNDAVRNRLQNLQLQVGAP